MTNEQRTGSRRDIARSEWRAFLEQWTAEHEGQAVTIEVVGVDYGDQLEAEELPFAYASYDEKEDVVVVAVGGRDRRYPVVLRHMISHPAALLAAQPAAGMMGAIELVDVDGVQSLVTFHRLPALPPIEVAG